MKATGRASKKRAKRPKPLTIYIYIYNGIINLLLKRKGMAEAMKYLINVHLLGGEIRTDLFFDSMEEIEKYIIELKQELTPIKKVVVYDADTKEALKIIKV